jgi:hypothetical protein
LLCGVEIPMPVAGPNLCGECTAQNARDERDIERLIEFGHTYHCSARIIWGDGECTCAPKEKT